VRSTGETLGSVVLDGAAGAAITCVLRARGADYALLAGLGDAEPVLVGHADPRWLDSVSTGGFLGVWLGVHGSSHGRASGTVVRVERVEYLPVG
jgi:alpha-N-arabinofuranosidase